METASLNKAHQQHRRADALLKYKKFEEAIECHEKAAELLEDAIKVTENPRSIESLKLQKNYHLRQKKIILMKKEQSENVKTGQDNTNKQTILNSLCENVQNLDDNATLQSAIYRTFEETDTLLVLLMKKGSSGNSDTESLKSVDAGALAYDVIDTPNLNTILGTKYPKDDTVVIEELKTLNDQLRGLINHLLIQLDESSKEINRLQDRIRHLENEDGKAISKGTTHHNLKVVTDSSGATSPYVFSPCSELSPDLCEISSIPPLAPLEIPKFDFSTLAKRNSTNI